MLRQVALAGGLAALLACSSLPAPASAQDAAEPVSADDPYLWLEEIDSDRAMAWVKAQNERSLAVLEGDPLYVSLHEQVLGVLESSDRIPAPGLRGDGRVSNFWQDASHVRGVWRMTALDSYRTAAPEWDIVLDIDALSAAEGKNWVYRDALCLPPEETRCLVYLSDGGEDAMSIREFDIQSKSFVPGGFDLPSSKGAAVWIDQDTLMLTRDFGEGSLTQAGFPMIVKLLRRGQALDQATEVFRGQSSDVNVGPIAVRDADGVLKATLILRGRSYYDFEIHQLKGDGSTTRLELPANSRMNVYFDGWQVFTTNQDWTAPSGQEFKTGDIIAYPLEAWLADPTTQARLILRPGERESVGSIAATRNRLVVALYENVRGSVYSYEPAASGEWRRVRLDLPENVTVDVRSTSSRDDTAFVGVAGYLNPSSLYLADAATGQVVLAKSLPAQFDAEGMRVDQFEARSADGTAVPYFVVRRDDSPMNGDNPTLLFGYGGFQFPQLPTYSPTVGKLWLERGGTYVVANIRGGGEFGPRWHQAAVRENRQRGHEDFQAVAQDLIARGITSQPRLGVMGASQGGLLMGAMLTQRPDLINAAVIQIPLFDMLRFHQLLAGASWIAEYGNPDIPEERAWIERYSPYQNLRAGQPYPEVFIHTSTKDDRVHPGHARKAAARLEELGYPVLFYEATDGGHSSGANLRETARRRALEYTYLSRRLMDALAR